ncbi:MAG: hypothetical protein ACYTKD_19370 [Planctomycetota bacterium]
MGKTAHLVAAGVVAALVVVNVALVISTRGRVAALRDEVRALTGFGAKLEDAALARADLDALKTDLDTRIRAEHAALRSGLERTISATVGRAVREERAKLPRRAPASGGPAPAGDPLEAEAEAFFGRLLDAHLEGRHQEAVAAAANAAGRYDGTRSGERIKRLAQCSSRETGRWRAEDYARRARLAAAEGTSARHRLRAEHAYTNAIARDPTNARYHREVAEFYARAGEDRKAEAEWANVIALKNREPFGYIARGKLREKLGRLQEALTDYRAALRVHPENAEAKERLDAVQAKLGIAGEE